MEKIEKRHLQYLGLNAENLLGYLYSGIIFLFGFTISEPESTKEIKESMGAVLLLISAMTFGVIFYTFYFRIIGEFILFPMQYAFHDFLDYIRGKKGENLTSTTKFLRHLGVKYGKGHEAYQEIKANLYPDNKKHTIMLQHGELNLLYLTFFISLFILVFNIVRNNNNYIIAQAVLVALFFFISIISDTKQQSTETLLIKSLNRRELLNFLRAQGFIDESDKRIEISFHHVGYISSNVSKFEAFWCNILGYEKTFSSRLRSDKCKQLFETELECEIYRYSRDQMPDVEVHILPKSFSDQHTFFEFGINHVCLQFKDRDSFIKSLPGKIEIYKFSNPEGWENVFIRDFERNYIEIRQEMN